MLKKLMTLQGHGYLHVKGVCISNLEEIEHRENWKVSLGTQAPALGFSWSCSCCRAPTWPAFPPVNAKSWVWGLPPAHCGFPLPHLRRCDQNSPHLTGCW